MEYEFYCGNCTEVFEFNSEDEEDVVDIEFNAWVVSLGLKDEVLEDIKSSHHLGYYRV